jgi:hypothetical protein
MASSGVCVQKKAQKALQQRLVSHSCLVVLKLRHVVVAALPKSIVLKDGRELKTLPMLAH